MIFYDLKLINLANAPKNNDFESALNVRRNAFVFKNGF